MINNTLINHDNSYKLEIIWVRMVKPDYQLRAMDFVPVVGKNNYDQRNSVGDKTVFTTPVRNRRLAKRRFLLSAYNLAVPMAVGVGAIAGLAKLVGE